MKESQHPPISVHRFSDSVTITLKLSPMSVAILDASLQTISSSDTYDPSAPEELSVSSPVISVSGFWLSRVNVPDKFRGQKFGSLLLDRFLSVMDNTQHKTLLAINPSGRLDYSVLEAWYARRGFVADSRLGGLFIREPRPVRLREPLDFADL